MSHEGAEELVLGVLFRVDGDFGGLAQLAHRVGLTSFLRAHVALLRKYAGVTDKSIVLCRVDDERAVVDRLARVVLAQD